MQLTIAERVWVRVDNGVLDFVHVQLALRLDNCESNGNSFHLSLAAQVVFSECDAANKECLCERDDLRNWDRHRARQSLNVAVLVYILDAARDVHAAIIVLLDAVRVCVVLCERIAQRNALRERNGVDRLSFGSGHGVCVVLCVREQIVTGVAFPVCVACDSVCNSVIFDAHLNLRFRFGHALELHVRV